MNLMDPRAFLREMLDEAQNSVLRQEEPILPDSIRDAIQNIVSQSEAAKGVLAVTMTSLVYKCLHSNQDIRCHQSSIQGGYSGRTFDTQYITPFLKEQSFPAMAESGWLTRSLEQKVPYSLDYPGAIRPQSLKDSFLFLIDRIEGETPELRRLMLLYLLSRLISQRERNRVVLAVPRNLTIAQILQLLKNHFEARYKYEGASRLPVLALYAVYKVLVIEFARYRGTRLLQLESHTSADRRSGRMGDIDIVDASDQPFEALEVKFGIKIGLEHIDTAYQKFMDTPIQRYYILSTEKVVADELPKINERILDIKNTHGCQVIVNGVYATIRYYLRLLSSPTDFIMAYTESLLSDSAIKHEHKIKWNKLVEELARAIH